MSEDTIKRVSLDDPKLRDGKTDWEAVDALTDEEIEAAIADDPDVAPILDDEWFEKAEFGFPFEKTAISIRVDNDVLAFFKKGGKGYQTRMNAVLRAYMDAQTKKRKKAG
ncbi:MAG: BrnA antitoxin family protein [Alphaproteobacteria bacterium]|nr:BrnA antitoxin family protein [Alphaproteobacteria bacterium]